MNKGQLRVLAHMKKLINEGKRRFKTRKDRDYLQDLLEIRISESEAWNLILELNSNFYYYDSKPSYYRQNDTLIFKRKINGINTYIKLAIEQNKDGEETVCWSFHIDN